MFNYTSDREYIQIYLSLFDLRKINAFFSSIFLHPEVCSLCFFLPYRSKPGLENTVWGEDQC